MYSSKQRHAVWQKIIRKGLLLPLFIFGVVLVTVFSQNSSASAATANTLNFQGRLRTNTGALVADGSYNIEFKIYDSQAAGASAAGVCSLNSSTDDCWWREVRTVSVQNGYFSVYLGDTSAGGTAFTSGLPWDQDLWLTMNVNTDGEMTPRFKLTAVPYAFRAGALVDASGNAKTANDFAQLAPSSIQTINAAIAALRLNQTGSGSLLQLQGNGTDVFTVDKTGNTVLGAGITIGNSSSTTAGTIRWNGSAFQGYNGSSWTSLGSGSVMPFVSKTKLVTETQNSTVNPTAALQADDELFFPIGANETWNYRFVVQSSVNATPDIKFSVTAPAGAVCVNSVTDLENAVSVAGLGCGVSSGNLAALTAVDTYEIVGSVTNGATAGNVTLNWAQNTANALNVTVIAGSSVEASRSVGGSSADVAFIQNGNSFGGLAVLGTNDANGLSIETNGVERIQVLSTGESRFSDDIIANRTTTGVTGTTIGTGTNTTTLTLTADVFSVNDVVLIDNVGQDYYTRITVDPGTGSYTVSPAITFATGRTVTRYTVQNIGATSTTYSDPTNRFFQGYFLGGVVVGAGSTTISDGIINSTTDLTLQSDGGNVVLGGGLNVTGVIAGDGSGLINIDGSSVVGSTITGLDASNVATGTLSDARLSANVALLNGGQTFSVLTSFSGGLSVTGTANVTGDIAATGEVSGATIVGDGSGLTSLNATNISAGTVADARLTANVTLLGNTFNGNNQLVQLNGSGALPALNGSALTSLSSANLTGALAALNGSALTNLSAANLTGALPAISGASLTSLNGTNISSGTVADARLSANVALLNGGQTFSALTSFGAGLSATGNINASGQVAGATVTGDGAGLTNLSAGNVATGTLADARLSANVALLSGTQTFTGSKTFSGGLVLGQSTLSSLATVARAVSLPDEAGTVCLSNSNNCGFLRIAAGSLQTDASNNDVLAVNKTSATGNLINLQRSGVAAFTVANSGALQIQSTNAAALDIRNAGGTSYFSVDTSGGTVRIGPATADATGVLFVLDTKNTTGDPAIGSSTNAQYYNSADARTRCYENGFWSDCSVNRILGETTLGVAGNTITVTLAANTEFLQCRISAKGRTVASIVNLRFNGDAGAANYGWNTYGIATTAVIDAQDSSDSEMQLNGTTTGAVPFTADVKISNFADTRKAVDWTAVGAEAIGTDMNRYSGVGTWNNVVAQISSVSFIASAGNFTVGSHAWCEGRNIR